VAGTLFVVVHLVQEHAQKKCCHAQHEHDHAQTHQAIVGEKQVHQHFHQGLSWGFDGSLCVKKQPQALMKVKNKTQSHASIDLVVIFCLV
jgi:hypothetical protein